MSILDKQTQKNSQPVFIVFIAIIIAMLLFINRSEQDKQSLPEAPISLEAYSVYSETVAMSIQSQGMVQPSTETLLVAEVQGRITEVGEDFVAGGKISKGDVLLKIDDLAYRTAVVRAKAALAKAETALAEEQGRAEVAFQDWSKHNKNSNRSEEAKSLALREPQIKESIARLNAAKADLEHALEQLKRTNVLAPYDGIIKNRFVDLGQHVSLGMNLGQCFSTEKAKVRLPIAEHKLDLIDLENNGDSTSGIILSVDLPQSSHQWSARLSHSERVIDERNRMLYLVAEIIDPYQLKKSNNNHPLRIGTFVSAKIFGKKIEGIFRIPQTVLQPDDSVWIVGDDGKLQRRVVNIIMADSEYAFINKGLHEEDKIASGYIESSVLGREVNIARLIRVPRLSPQTLTDNNVSPLRSLPADTH